MDMNDEEFLKLCRHFDISEQVRARMRFLSFLCVDRWLLLTTDQGYISYDDFNKVISEAIHAGYGGR